MSIIFLRQPVSTFYSHHTTEETLAKRLQNWWKKLVTEHAQNVTYRNVSFVIGTLKRIMDRVLYCSMEVLQRQPFVDVLQNKIFKNFAICTGKNLCWSFFVTKMQAFRSTVLFKRDSNTVVFLWILRNF